ncbi:hypothetical protein CYL77_08195 [Corynebacterium glutamicum]|uniref:Uncharacterized protein n=2 Tax=Corynebacteriaceae TaxID=1653 RepID=Q8NQ34_CORGL|nr:hypothetical protein B7P23_04790 [Corynebacterium glutamicum]CCH24775.1 hypothetical protein WA5_1555 [Corynebacterium glutamicum K051]BAB99010.1 Hypothetical protein [Corynebacterium glutamicum ATCC 13032]AUI01120.1 hypothetical protein CYL77_08195 [Corynebacterium glutamicum]AUI04769.1 hypothetical protein C0I99_11895 [Corynebacterium glutamicum]
MQARKSANMSDESIEEQEKELAALKAQIDELEKKDKQNKLIIEILSKAVEKNVAEAEAKRARKYPPNPLW